MGYVNNQTKKVELPSNHKYWAEIRLLTYGDLKLYKGYGGDLPLSIALKLALSITAWNLDDESGAVLPINEASIDLLQENDLEALADAATPKEDERIKKNSPKQPTATSQPA